MPHVKPVSKVDGIVLGAGAAGLTLAANLKNLSLVIVDHSTRPGIKLSVCGGGFCNFSNRNLGPVNYLGSNPRFCLSALKNFDTQDAISMMEGYRLPWEERDHGRLFLRCKSQSLVDGLYAQCLANGHQFKFSSSIIRVSRGEQFQVELQEQVLLSSKLVIATGGLPRANLGASDLGLQIATGFALPVMPVKPGLVAMKFHPEEKGFFDLQGISLPVNCSLDQQSWNDELLFTHTGVSGPIGLQVSNYLEGGFATLDFLPGLDLEVLLLAAQDNHPQKPLFHWLQTYLPKRLIQALIGKDFGPKFTLDRLKQTHLQQLSVLVKHRQVRLQGCDGYERAEVMIGGVDTRSLSPKTMECKAIPGLYLVGEVLDVTGWLGGYNLHWAWASSRAASLSLQEF